MKRTLLVFIIALLLGAGFISLISRDSGYVLLALGNTSVETSLWFALLSLGILFYLLLLPIRIFFGSRVFFGKHHIKQQQKNTRKGMLAFSKGEWTQAVDSLLKADENSGASFANYLIAARAANEMGNWEKVELILGKALTSDPKAKVAIDITRAELLLQNKQWQAAAILLEELKKTAPRHRVVLSLLRSAYLHSGRWVDLQNHIQALRQSKIFDDQQLNEWEAEALEAMLVHAIDNADKETHPLQHVQRCWNKLSATSQGNPAIFQQYVEGLASLGGEDQAEKLIKRHLNERWNDALARLYGMVRGSNLKSQLETAQRWLKAYPHNAALLLTLGRLAMHNRQWEQARLYLEQSLAQDENAETAMELGRLLLAGGQTERGKQLLNRGLQEHVGLSSAPTP